MGTDFLDALKIFLLALGAFSTLWGAYDLFTDAGGQASVGTKKVIGGIAFMVLTGLVMTWIISDIKKVEQKAGVTTGSLNYVYSQNAEQQSVVEFNNIIAG